jgi:hypothetical protein
MRGEMRVLPESMYASWRADSEADAARRYDPTDPEANWGWAWQQD